MTTQTVFRLGALATLLTALGYAVGEALYLFGNVETLFFAWFFVIVSVFQVFAYMALYAAQVKRGDIIAFVGFVISIIGLLYSLMDSERRLALRAGLITEVQLEQTQQITSFILLNAVGNAALVLGWIIFGYGIVRTRVFPRWAGFLMMLTGVAMVVRDFFIFEYAFAVLAVVVYGSLGWALWKNPNAPE